METAPLTNFQNLADPFYAQLLFDKLDDMVFVVKDREARYVALNMALVRRCGLRHKHEIIGRSAWDIFPASLAASYIEQDRFVTDRNQPILDRLELHFYDNQKSGWCLTDKFPLTNSAGEVVGLVGLSRDLLTPDQKHPVYQRIGTAVNYIYENFSTILTVEKLSGMTNCSVAQFERYIKRIFKLTPKQLIIKIRMEEATRLLEETSNIAEIAHACGYNDHSAFSRQFKAVVGLSPQAYRELKFR
ncbi:MAG TPA: AraC family transcriptional regulator [Chloroflexia bacterium]|nr:AraC family transcriptional regulator [Chloroflexia bacterium]